jgi:hypothetical protein
VGFITGAGITAAGRTSTQLHASTDWMPSLLSLALNGVGAPIGGAGVQQQQQQQQQQQHDWRELVRQSGDPPFELGDGLDCWAALAHNATTPRTEVIHEAHPPAGPDVSGATDDGNGQALRVGDFKLILEKGPMWHGPPNDLWYESGSNPSRYQHVVQCGPPPPETAPDYCHPEKLPCLFNIRGASRGSPLLAPCVHSLTCGGWPVQLTRASTTIFPRRNR